MRFKATLDRRLFELAILAVAISWHSGHEWAAHAKLAREEGIAEDVIAALRRGENPHFEKADEAAIFAFAHELARERRVSAERYRAARDVLSETKLVELVNALGYYIALAAMLNAFDVHPPEGLDDPWPPSNGLIPPR